MWLALEGSSTRSTQFARPSGAEANHAIKSAIEVAIACKLQDLDYDEVELAMELAGLLS